jgi:phosphoglycerate dehydrogenase-like enzyme
MPDAFADAVLSATPPGWVTHVVDAQTDSSGDGSQAPSDESLAAIADAEVYLGYGFPKALLAAAPLLRWVHTGAAGVGSLLYPEMVASPVVITNTAGIGYGAPIAEYVLAGVLHFLRGFDVAAQLQRKAQWDARPFSSDEAMVREVAEVHAVVVGARGIGGATIARLAALGARVTCVRQDATKGAPAGAAQVIGLRDIDTVLPTADVLVLAAPLTPETNGLLTASRIATLPAGAIVCNVSRGAMVDEPALAAALGARRIRGAVLDVFAREPLAVDSPLWQLPNVLHTPHVSGISPRLFWTRLQELFLDNWTRWRDGAPLRNLVDKGAGY